MGYSLGVDLGTTFSAAATLDEGDALPTMVGLGNRALQIPSVGYVRSDGTMVVGEQAEHLAMTDPTRVVREFKRRIGDDVPLLVAGHRFPPEALMARLLRWVVDQTTERRGEPPSHITLTHPAAWTSDFKVAKLRLAAKIAGLPDVATCPEPVAAALHYASRNRVDVGDRICIYDLGGGTFDVCVLAKTARGFDIVGRPGGESLLGGIDFDRAIIEKIVAEAPGLFASVDPDDPALCRFYRDCVDAKEALSVDVSTTIPLTLGGSSTSVRLTRSELEALINGRLDETIICTHRELSSAGVDAADLRTFVLIGGSSRIPLVTEKLTSAFRCAVSLNTHPKHEVALGAALAGRLGTLGSKVLVGPRSDPARISSTAPDTGTPPDSAIAGGRRGRSAGGRLLRASAMGISAVAVAGVVIVGGRAFSTPAGAQENAALAGTILSGPTSVSESPTSLRYSETATTAVSQSPAGSAGAVRTPSADSSHIAGPVESETSTPGSKTVPAQFDQLTVQWFEDLCAVGNQINSNDLRSDTTYPSLAAAQETFVQSFDRRATATERTADELAVLAGPVAGGRVNPTAAIASLRNLSGILRAGAQSLASASPQNSAELVQAAETIDARALDGYQPADLGNLSRQEQGFVLSLPGCNNS